MEKIDPVPYGRWHWIVSPEVALERFLIPYAKATQRSYNSAMRRWFRQCAEAGIDPWKAEAVHMESWLDRMPNGSARDHHLALCAFYKWCSSTGYIENNVTTNLRARKRGRPRATSFATPDELRRMLIASKELSLDHHAVIACLILTGSRGQELLNVDVCDVTLGEQVRVTITRKNGNVDTIIVPGIAGDAVRKLCKRRRTGALFREKGERMTQKFQCRIVQKLARQVGCEQHITPHSLRRSFVTFARDLGLSDMEIMAMTGHSTTTMVDLYDRRRYERDSTAGLRIADALA